MLISGFIGGKLPNDSILNTSMGNELFKNKYSFEDRKKEFDKIKEKYPDRIPVIVEKSKNCKTLPDIDKKKYLVPKDLSFSQFMYVVRKRIKLDSDQALYIFINDTLISGNKSMAEIYHEFAEPCGFLFAKYTAEATFG